MATDAAAADNGAALIREQVVQARAAGSVMLPEPAGKAILRASGVATPRGEVVRDPTALVDAARRITGPWVLKAVSGTVVHKSDAGAVRLGITDPAALPAIAGEMTEHLRGQGYIADGFLLEETAPAGVEVIVGVVRKEDIGPVLMVGIGGIFVELLGDVSLRILPVTRRDVVGMLDGLRAGGLLRGARGAGPVDVDSLVDLILRIAGPNGLMSALPEDVAEVEFNPVLVGVDGAVAVDARFLLAPEGASGDSRPARPAVDLTAMFAPRSVAVYGASTRKTNSANLFIRNLRDFGFDGEIVPVHPSAECVEGIAARRAADLTPGSIDYAYVAVPAEAVPETVASMGGAVRFAQVVSSGFGETGTDGERAAALDDAAVAAGVRILGPNCIGTHSTRGQMAFLEDADRTIGGVSVVSQSGGLSIDMLRQGTVRGIRFNNVVSVGNAADLGTEELVRHFLDDPDTTVVALYLESVTQAAGLLRAVRARRVRKPLVLLAGGRTDGGARAASSHTGALLDDRRLWSAIAEQSGALLVDTLEELLDAVVALQDRDPAARAGSNEVVLFGNGGGSSVLACDALDRVGLATAQWDADTAASLGNIEMPAGTSLANPIDAPAPAIAHRGGAAAERIMNAVLGAARPPAVVIVHLNVGVIVSHNRTVDDPVAAILDAVARSRDGARHRSHILLALRSDGRAVTEDGLQRHWKHARALGLTVYDEILPAARGAAALVHYDTGCAIEGVNR